MWWHRPGTVIGNGNRSFAILLSCIYSVYTYQNKLSLSIHFRLRQEFDDISKQTMTAFRQLPVGYRSSHQVAANSKMSPGVDELDRSIGQV